MKSNRIYSLPIYVGKGEIKVTYYELRVRNVLSPRNKRTRELGRIHTTGRQKEN